jgi:FkbM family methyltransferase
MSFRSNSFRFHCLMFFRHFIWRLGRKLYCFARNELPLGPEVNGEYLVLDTFLEAFSKDSVTLIDVGANKGEWSLTALTYLKKFNIKGSLHLFEPAEDSFRYLQSLLSLQAVKLNKAAVSNVSSNSQLFVFGDLCGTNSLHSIQGGMPQETETISLDEYVANQRLEHIDFVKSDTEGHDFKVIEGAANLLTAGKVSVWQFEYNWRWINARCYLKDVFEFIRDKPYWIGRVSRSGVEIYKDWHPELERYFETNFILVHKDCEFIAGLLVYSEFDRSNAPVMFTK